MLRFGPFRTRIVSVAGSAIPIPQEVLQRGGGYR
jgi:hypothetical protein